MVETTAEFQARMEADLDEHLCHGPLSEEITYTPNGGAASTFRAAVYDKGKRPDEDDSGYFYGQEVELEVSRSDIAAPANLDSFVWNSLTFTVFEVYLDPAMGPSRVVGRTTTDLELGHTSFRTQRD